MSAAHKDRWLVRIISISFLLLPTLNYFSLVGFALCMGAIFMRFPQAVLRFLWRRGFIVIAVGLTLSAVMAYDRGAAYLQLANFLPFIGVMAAIAVWLRQTPHRNTYLYTWSAHIVLITLPVNFFALIEYLLMAPAVMAQVGHLWGFSWYYAESYPFGHRAKLLFGHPNILACYVIFVFCLGLGLILHRFASGPNATHLNSTAAPSAPHAVPPRLMGFKGEVTWLSRHPKVLGFATAANLVGLFCTGSRNGLIVLLIIVSLAAVMVPGYGRLKAWVFAGAAGVVAAALSLGIGGRRLTWELFTDDPRLAVWRIAWNHAVTHPWLGIGLGNYQILYQPGDVPGHSEMPHAHGLWMMLISEAGFPVAIGLTVVVGIALYQAVLSLPSQLPPQRALLVGYLLAFLSLSLFSLVDLTIAFPRSTLIGWFALGVIYSLTPQTQTGLSPSASRNPALKRPG